MTTTNTITIHDGLIAVAVPLYIVAHLTDPSQGMRPVILGKSEWFSEAEAIDHAQTESAYCPAPQRFAVYSPTFNWIASYQSGEPQPAFVVE